MQKKNYEQWKEDFIQKARERIQQELELGSRGPVIVREKPDTINGVKKEALLMPDLNASQISPSIYLDGFYMGYLSDEPEEKLVEAVLSVFRAHKDMSVDTTEIFDYEKAKEHLRIRAIRVEGNAKWINKKICEVKGDFIHSCKREYSSK